MCDVFELLYMATESERSNERKLGNLIHSTTITKNQTEKSSNKKKQPNHQIRVDRLSS